MVKLNERMKNEELRELLGLEPISLMNKKSSLGWFGHVKQKDDMETLGLSQEDVQSRNGEGELRGQPANPGSPGKMAVKTECVCYIVEEDVVPLTLLFS